MDELPQIFNVFIGEMSFVGPRPWIPEYYARMSEVERGRVKVRPGITGLAQVKGRNGLSVFQKIGYDLEYVEKFSAREDLRVVAMTVKVVLAREGIGAIGGGGVDGDMERLVARNRGVRCMGVVG